MKNSIYLRFTMILISLLISCNSEIEPINFGKDSCHFCKMTIMDPKFGAEMITSKGKIYKFDDVNCMINHLHKTGTPHSEFRGFYILDWLNPATLIDATKAQYIYSDGLKTPMASYLAATLRTSDADSLQSLWKGSRMTWNEILQFHDN